jgi:ABC-type transport system involved in multi-copper enzyme maturation permease subunit
MVLQRYLLTAAGGLALTAASVPLVLAIVSRFHWRRVWALTTLSLKEAIRGRVLYVFTLMALVFLFASYFVPYKPEDQIRNYVLVVYLTLSLLFLPMAALLGAFSIPRDVTKQTIHTIVTKPVERYEIVLGRFLGNAILLSAALFLLTGLSLIYVARGVTEQAREESYKARVPVFGDSLIFHGTEKASEGENVGRMWGYRSYISGRPPEEAGKPLQYAVWAFNSLPDSIRSSPDDVRFEFTFDVYRTTKQDPRKEKEGILCTLVFADGRLSPRQIEENTVQAERERPELQARAGQDNSGEDTVDEQLFAKYGVYELNGVPVVDYHTGALKVPAGIFRSLASRQATAAADAVSDTEPAEFKVLARVGQDPSSVRQKLGVAKRDIYLLAGELPFWQNFFKGVMGLWLLVLLVLGVAVACSTYLSGVISLLCTFFLFGAGVVRPFIRSMSVVRAQEGGGPIQAAIRLYGRQPIGAPIDQSPVYSLGMGMDNFYSWLLRYVLKGIPDVRRFDLTDYVANGFDISWTGVLLLDNLVPLLGYLIPWAILAYYLMNYREIANPS